MDPGIVVCSETNLIRVRSVYHSTKTSFNLVIVVPHDVMTAIRLPNKRLMFSQQGIGVFSNERLLSSNKLLMLPI